jgi:hypothetical protein
MENTLDINAKIVSPLIQLLEQKIIENYPNGEISYTDIYGILGVFLAKALHPISKMNKTSQNETLKEFCESLLIFVQKYPSSEIN